MGQVTVTTSNVADSSWIVSFGGSMYGSTEPLLLGFGVGVAEVSNLAGNIAPNSWLNLTNITSLARSIGVAAVGNADPNTPVAGRNNFTLGFPQNDVDWTDLAISPTTGILYAAMGNPTLNLFESDDAALRVD